MSKADHHCCEERAILPPGADAHVPCNEPARKVVGWPDRREGPYRMCLACADHSVKNRGARVCCDYDHSEPGHSAENALPIHVGVTIVDGQVQRGADWLTELRLIGVMYVRIGSTVYDARTNKAVELQERSR